MNYEVTAELRPPESAEWLPLGFREPPTRWYRGRFDEVLPALPDFDRGPFAMAPDSEDPWRPNELLDLISTRESNRGPWQQRPVAVVSKSYRLIPHRELAHDVSEALAEIGIEPDGLDTHASLERYGARLSLEINMPAHWLAHPGDGHPLVLQLRCLNSVDATSTLRMRFVWYRLVCTNGLVVGFAKDERRMTHRESRRPHGLREEIESGLALAKADRLGMTKWLERRVDPSRFPSFVDGPLKALWGARDAARFLHIARTGYDAEFENRFQTGEPSKKAMAPTIAVPGNPELIRTEWEAAQALSWIARDRRDPSDLLDRLLEIPALIHQLSNH